MGRSVNYHSDNRAVIYLNEDEEIYNFDELIWGILQTLQNVAPSFDETRAEWHDREVRKFAENSLCTVWISEYCGLISLSFVPVEESYHTGKNIRGLAERWIDKFIVSYRKTMGKDILNPVGTFSNGERIFERATA